MPSFGFGGNADGDADGNAAAKVDGGDAEVNIAAAADGKVDDDADTDGKAGFGFSVPKVWLNFNNILVYY